MVGLEGAGFMPVPLPVADGLRARRTREGLVAGLVAAVALVVALISEARGEFHKSPSHRWTPLLVTTATPAAETVEEIVGCRRCLVVGMLRTLETRLILPAVGEGSCQGSEIATPLTSAPTWSKATAPPVSATLKGPGDRSRTS